MSGHLLSSSARSCRCMMVAAAGALIAWHAASVHADVVSANFVHNNLFNYRLDHMPDLDQKRLGVAGDGSYHCVPTATLNLILYAANHGFSDVQPGPAYWQAQENYDTATGLINIMGFFMQTSYNPGDPDADPPVSPSGGTDGGNATDGLQWYLDNQPDYFIVNHHLTAPGFTTNFANVAQSVIGGNIGTMSYGRYDVLGYSNGKPKVQRNGGHATTIVRAYKNATTSEIWVRDPADASDSLSAQSPFTNRIIQMTDLDVILMDNEDPANEVGEVTMTALNYDPTADRIAFMDGHRSMRPKTGYSFDSSLTQVQQTALGDFQIGPGPSQQAIPVPTGTVVFQVDYSPILGEYLMIAGDPNQQQLYRVNPLNGTSQPVPLPSTPKLMLACASGQHVVIGVDGSIRLLSPTLNPIADADIPTTQFSLNFAAIKFEYKPQNANSTGDESRIVLASTPARKVLFYKMDLGTPLIRELPTLIPGNLRDMAIEPGTGRVWFAMDQSNTLYGVKWDDNGQAQIEQINHASLINFTGLEFDDSGDMYACTNGKVVVMRRTSAGTWDIVANSPFQGIVCTGKFRMMRSSSNYDPAFHNHPRWTTNLDPSEIVLGVEKCDCRADVVIDDMVNVSDLLDVIANWGPSQPGASNADIDEDGAIGVSDLLEVIAHWGPCP